jgi:hypothetical protein
MVRTSQEGQHLPKMQPLKEVPVTLTVKNPSWKLLQMSKSRRHPVVM